MNITPAVGTHRGHYFVKLYILKSTGFFDLIFGSDSFQTFIYGRLNITHHYTQEIDRLVRFLETPKQKTDKEDCLKLIRQGKKNIDMMSKIVTEQDWETCQF